MALHKDFPKSPHEILDPSIRWFPADEALRKDGYQKLLPPLVDKIRKEVKKWRREKKNNLIKTTNLEMKDLSDELLEKFSETEIKEICVELFLGIPIDFY